MGGEGESRELKSRFWSCNTEGAWVSGLHQMAVQDEDLLWDLPVGMSVLSAKKLRVLKG